MNIGEYHKKLQEAVRVALEVTACDDCRTKFDDGSYVVGRKAYINARICQDCAIRAAWPIEDVAYERIRALAERPIRDRSQI